MNKEKLVTLANFYIYKKHTNKRKQYAKRNKFLWQQIGSNRKKIT